MTPTEKRCFLVRYINILDMSQKRHVCMILLTHGIDVKQNNNGAYCYFDELEAKGVVDVVYQYVNQELSERPR